jgi:hypothetical protein
MPSERRRIQRMRAQKMREEVVEKEREEYFNTIRPMIPMKQGWRVKEKVDTPVPMTSNDNMDLLDNDEGPLIKDGSPPLTGIDINMVFTLLALRRRSLKCVLTPRRSCSRSPKSQVST